MRPALSSNTLKLLAMLFMLIDHIGLLFFPEELSWRVFGRLSFPIFAFLIAEGFLRTGNLSAYAKRLIIFASVSQIPYALALSAAGAPPSLNIFFTLAVGLLALALLGRLPRRFAIPTVLAIAAVAELLRFDYGAYGVLTILASHLMLTAKRQGVAALVVLPFLYATGVFPLGASAIQLFAAFSVPFLLLYNKERGIALHRLFFYSFYPGHLFILWIIWYSLNMI